MPLFKLIITIAYSGYIAWWSAKLMSQLRYVGNTEEQTNEGFFIEWFIDKMLPRIIWIIYLSMVYAILSAPDNTTALVYLLISLSISVLLLGKPHGDCQYRKI